MHAFSNDEAILDTQVQEIYLPFAQAALALQQHKGRRILVGIAGAPGSGKSTFAASAAAEINQLAGNSCAVVVGMDGWHYPNELLEEKTILRHGVPVALKTYKGVPESFDFDSFWAFLAELKSKSELAYPVYDRAVHNPSPEAGKILASHSIVLVEGNYLLLDEEPWRRIRPILDLTCFITAGESLRWRDLFKRHLRGRKTPQQAIRHIARVDMANALRIGRPQADITLVRRKDTGFCDLQMHFQLNP